MILIGMIALKLKIDVLLFHLFFGLCTLILYVASSSSLHSSSFFAFALGLLALDDEPVDAGALRHQEVVFEHGRHLWANWERHAPARW